MNSIVQTQFPVLKETMGLRDQIMAVLTDTDLKFKLPGSNPTLGVLCHSMGDIQQTYIDSFRSFKQDWTYHCDDPALSTSVDALKKWYADLDAALLKALEGLSEEDIQTAMIDRGHNHFPVMVQLHVYREALLIFYAKVITYFNALEKPVPEQVIMWIG